MQFSDKFLFPPEGRSLSLEEMWSSVHPTFRRRLQTSPLNTITLQVGVEQVCHIRYVVFGDVPV